MANASKMSTTNALKAAPPQVCALLDVLPPELRLLVYEMAFHGSRVYAELALEQDSREEESWKEDSTNGQPHPVFLRHSAHFGLLLSCRRIYDEALPTYWSGTVLSVPPLDWELDLEDSYTWRLCCSLPEVAKMNVRHLRRLRLHAPRRGGVEKSAASLLGGFKSLATCGIDESTQIVPDAEIEYYFEKVAESDLDSDIMGGLSRIYPFGRFKMPELEGTELEQLEPKDFLRKVYGLDAAAVVFLIKTQEWEWYPGIEPGPVMDQFWNFSNGVFWECSTGFVDDEKGFEWVIHP